jgi:uncharacterized protein (DUF983 family)
VSDAYYPDLSPLATGCKGRCPRCGRGKLFAGYLTVAQDCHHCNLSYEFADAGDGAAWFVMLFVCIVGVGSILAVEIAYAPAWWVHVMIAVPTLILMPLLLLRPVKGVLICQQWKTKAEEGKLS